MADVFASWDEFDKYVQTLVRTRCIDNGKKIWWDIRPHPFFGTVELRIFDMPSTLNDVMGIAALCLAPVATDSWRYKHNIQGHALPRHLLEENNRRAMRYRLDAEIVDIERVRSFNM